MDATKPAFFDSFIDCPVWVAVAWCLLATPLISILMATHLNEIWPNFLVWGMLGCAAWFLFVARQYRGFKDAHRMVVFLALAPGLILGLLALTKASPDVDVPTYWLGSPLLISGSAFVAILARGAHNIYGSYRHRYGLKLSVGCVALFTAGAILHNGLPDTLSVRPAKQDVLKNPDAYAHFIQHHVEATPSRR